MGRIVPVNVLTGPRATVAGGGGQFYSTSFSSTQNPLSAPWSGGLGLGLDWQNMRCDGGTPGTVYGVGSSPGPPYNDCIATIQGIFNPLKHFVRILVRKDGGYVPPSTQEIELNSMLISAHSILGYEVTQGFELDTNIARWNGALNDFTVDFFDVISGAPFTVGNGDQVWAYFDYTGANPVISIYKNQNVTPDYVVTDTTVDKILSGTAPGIGAFARAGSGLDMKKYAINGFDGGDW